MMANGAAAKEGPTTEVPSQVSGPVAWGTAGARATCTTPGFTAELCGPTRACYSCFLASGFICLRGRGEA